MNKNEAEAIPSISDLWTNSPGELVMQYIANSDKEALGMTGFSWQVRKLIPGKHVEIVPGLPVAIYEASTPYRLSYYRGDTPEDAIGCLLKGMAQLSRDGSINPSNPHRHGVPPIQHVMSILAERLLRYIDHRNDHLDMSGWADSPLAVGAIRVHNGESNDDQPNKEARDAEDANFHNQMLHAVARDNEIIGALGTAIAALARVKDL